MNQDLELMRELLLWVADASRWELSYREQQASLTEDGSIDKKNEYNREPGTSLEGGHYTVVNFRPLPEQGPLSNGRESSRDQFLWNGFYRDGRPRHEEYSVSGEGMDTLHFSKGNIFLPAGFPLRKYWCGREQFEVTYNLNQLDIAGLLKVRYFHSEQEWCTEPPVSMYLTPKGADFVAYIRDTQRWEDLKRPYTVSTTAAAQKNGIFKKVLKWKRVTPQVAKAIDDRIQTVSILSNRATQMTEFIQGLPLG